MNPNQPSREQIEVRITALLLGELPAEEAELLRWTISQDPELQKLHSRLLLTVGLVREVVAHPEETPAEQAALRQLSDERRQKLLNYFKLPRPKPAAKELSWLKRIEVRPLVTALALVAIVAVIAALLLPATARSKRAATRAFAANEAREKLLEEKERSPSAVRTIDMAIPKSSQVNTWAAESAPATVPTASAPGAFISVPQALTPTPPPKTEIVLPETESSPAAPAGGPVYSQRVVGYTTVNTPLPTEQPSALKDELSVTRDQGVAAVQLQNSDPQQVAQRLQSMFGNSGPSAGGSRVAPPREQAGEVASTGGGGAVFGGGRGGFGGGLGGRAGGGRGAATPSQNSTLQQREQQGVTTMGQSTTSGNTGGSGGGFGGFGGGRGGRGGGRGGGGFGGGGGGGFSGGGAGGGNPFAAQFGGVSGGNVLNNGTAGGAVITTDSGMKNSVALDDKETKDQIKGTVSQLEPAPAALAAENTPAGRVDQFGLAIPSTAPATPGSGTVLAWNENGGDRSGAENQSGDARHFGAMLGPVPNTGSGQTEIATNERLRGVSGASGTDGDALQNRAAGGNQFFRILNPDGESDARRTPALGDSPSAGFAFNGGSEAAAPSTPAVQGYIATPTAATARPTGGNQMVQVESAWSPTAPVVSPPPPASATAAPSMDLQVGVPFQAPKNMAETLARKPDSGNGTLGLSDGNSYYSAGNIVVNNGKLSDNNSVDGELAANLGAAKTDTGAQNTWETGSGTKGFYDDNFTTGVTRDDANGLRYLVGSNAVVLENSERQKAAQLASDQQLTSGLRNSESSKLAANAQPTLETRVFKVDTNTFYDGLQNVTLQSFGGTGNSGGGRGNAVTGVGGLEYMNPNPTPQGDVAATAAQFFNTIGVNLSGSNAPGRSVAYNNQSGLLYVRGTPGELDTVGRVVQAMNQVASTNSFALAESGLQNSLRNLNILDTDLQATAPTPAIIQQQLQRYKDQQVEGEKNLEKLSENLADLKALQATNPAELRNVLPTVVTDNTLGELSAKLRQTEQKLAQLKQDYGASYPDVIRQQALADELNRQIDARVDGILTTMSSRQKLLRASLNALSNAVQQATQMDQPLPKPPANAPVPQPEFLTRENAFSTFSMNVSDVSYKLAQASLQKGQMPDPASIRSEEFINAFNYRDPEAAAGQPMAFASEVARDPFAQNRDFLRFSIKTAASGRPADRPLNLVLLLDTSGSMERADRVAIIREALRVLASQLQPQDMVSIVTFARTPRLWADGVPGNQAGAALDKVGGITPDGGTNLEEAMRLAYETARRHYLANGINRVVLLTDGAANLGNVNPVTLKTTVEAQRRQGIALDCFGIGWEDFNDDLLEELSGNGDGRYAFINSAEEADSDFAAKLAGALQVAAQDVKVQVEFNPRRVTAWRQIGYAKHQLTKEQFRDNSVIAAEIAAQEAGNALYTVETKPDGTGPIATVYVRYRIPGTQDLRERSWAVDYDGPAPALEQSSVAMRLAVVAAEFSEWLAQSPFAQEVTTDELLKDLTGVPQVYGCDQRPQQLEWMIRQAKSLAGK